MPGGWQVCVLMTWKIAVVATLLFFSQALAADKYFSLTSGAYFPGSTDTLNKVFTPVTVDYNTGWLLGGAVGIALDNGLRFENELSYRQARPRGESDDIWALGWLVNVWFDFRNPSIWTPYLGGGFGLGRGHASSPGHIDNTGIGIAYQTGGGVAVKMKNRISLDLGYKYFGISDTSSGGGVGSIDMCGSTVMAGIRIAF